MIELGIVGLDTSHASAFTDVVGDFEDMRIGGVWDGHDVRDEEYVDDFCARYDTQRYDDLSGLVDAVDAAMVLTVNWETHRPLAVSCLDAGLPTLVDKPLAGRRADVEAIERAADDAPLFGGSALPFHPKVASLPRGEDGRTVFAAGYNDFFYYRVHLSDTLRSLADAHWTEVRPHGNTGTTLSVEFADGTEATARFDGSSQNGRFSVLDVGDRTRTVEIPSDRGTLSEMYGPYLSAFRDVIVGDADHTSRLVDSTMLLLAIELAVEEDRPVRPDTDRLDTLHVDGDDFLAQYQPYY